jgi:2-iminobutanoate/2-iminopropanoate deaminase
LARQVISTSAAPAPRAAYSQAVSTGGLLFSAGFGPQDPETGQVEGTDVAAQTRCTVRNLTSVLNAAGLSLSDVVKVTVHLAHLKQDFVEFDKAYRECFPEPYPARTTVGSDLWDILVEIDLVAVMGAGDDQGHDDELEPSEAPH